MYADAPTGLGFGRRGDIAVPADYNGDDKADVAVFRPATGMWYIRGQLRVAFGHAGDLPLAAR